MQQASESAQQAVSDLLTALGFDTSHPAIIETPKRVAKAWHEMLSGYSRDPAEILSKRFADDCNEMITLTNIDFFSTCEHHLLPFHGVAHVAYIPSRGGGVVGLSKLARLVECFARRLQIQERLTRQVTNSLEEYLEPLGAACMIEATHLCMVCRGVRKAQPRMVTTALSGIMAQPHVKAEFLTTIQGGK